MDYDRNCARLLATAPADFAEYLQKNWFSCQAMWVSLYRRHLLTLGNNTTNRIESFNSQLKYELRKKRGLPPSLPETVGILLDLVFKKNSDATYKNFRNSATVATNVLLPEMKPAGLVYNDAAFRLLQTQVVKMKNKSFSHHQSASGGITVEDTHTGKLYDLTSGQDGLLECSCTFSSAFPGLPCCHILYSRKELGLPLFESTEIPDRWNRKSAFLNPPASNVELEEDVDTGNAESLVPGVNDNCDYSSAEEDAGKYMSLFRF